MVNAKWNQPGDPGGRVEVLGGSVVAYIKGRTYFGSTCTPDTFPREKYLNLFLLGKTIRYTTDLSAAQCGCNAALYLTNMGQHEDPSMCHDHYCDASSVCSGTCAEIDLQEANVRSWFSTIHMSGDSQGLGGGYGFMRHDWDASHYGPGASCIDTRKPFQVAVSFPAHPNGTLIAMDIRLSQIGSTCDGVSAHVEPRFYGFRGRQGLGEVSKALAAGMTPIISYWKQDGPGGMGWLDGLGPDGKGPCTVGAAETCGESVRFSDFSIEDAAASNWMVTA